MKGGALSHGARTLVSSAARRQRCTGRGGGARSTGGGGAWQREAQPGPGQAGPSPPRKGLGLCGTPASHGRSPGDDRLQREGAGEAAEGR